MSQSATPPPLFTARGWLTRRVRDIRSGPGVSSPSSPASSRIQFRPPRRCDLPVAADDIRHARAAVDGYAAWYAPAVLGGPLNQWAEVATAAAGLHRVGHGSQNLLSGGL